MQASTGTALMRVGALIGALSIVPFIIVGFNPTVGKCAAGPPYGAGLAFQLYGALALSGLACLLLGNRFAPIGTKKGWWMRFTVAIVVSFVLAPLSLRGG